MPLEKNLEYQCRMLVKARGGELLKFKSPGNKGVHDRLLVLPGFVAMIEFKKDKNAKVQPLQDWWQDRFAALRMPAYRVWMLAQFEMILAYADTHTTELRPRTEILGPNYINYRTISLTTLCGATACISALKCRRPENCRLDRRQRSEK